MPAKPLAIDLFCGLGGWTEGLLAEGYRVVGFDIERHCYPKMIRPEGDSAQKSPLGGSRRNANGESLFKDKPCHLRDTMKTAQIVEGEWAEYPAQLVLQDVRTLHGSQFKDAALIVASPPCQAYSYRAMPWKRAKALPPPDNTLFEACFRIQREACEAAGRHIPLVVENVRGAQKWVGRARWHYGSFYLWGDVPALMPMTRKRGQKVPGFRFDGSGGSFQTASVEQSGIKVSTMGAGWYPPDHPKHVPGLAFNTHAERATKNQGGSWFAIAHNTTSGHSRNPVNDHIKNKDADGYERDHPAAFGWKKPRTSSHSHARKAASAQIAKIPFELARHIARAWKPLELSA